jgi:hypothetical protein
MRNSIAASSSSRTSSTVKSSQSERPNLSAEKSSPLRNDAKKSSEISGTAYLSVWGRAESSRLRADLPRIDSLSSAHPIPAPMSCSSRSSPPSARCKGAPLAACHPPRPPFLATGPPLCSYSTGSLRERRDGSRGRCRRIARASDPYGRPSAKRDDKSTLAHELVRSESEGDRVVNYFTGESLVDDIADLLR